MKKNTFWGLVLILIAVYLIASHLGYAPVVSIVTIAGTFFFGYVVISGIRKKSFVEIMFGLSIIYCMYEKYLHIPHISNWIIVVAALLLGSGLDMVFRDALHKKGPSFSFEYSSDGEKSSLFTSSESTSDEAEVNFENNFGTASKYVNSAHFRSANVENNFGSLNIYMENAVIFPGGALINCDNNFGETNLYLPKNCRAEVHEDTAFGSIRYRGATNTDPNAPVVHINASANFGHITIYFA